ncbi:MAG: hypothetical protein C5S45_03870 [Candidatus Methanocomedens sp.]|nr:MAG: hypothetical protein C5S45_03870 [ANME-2 cluster archaeon]
MLYPDYLAEMGQRDVRACAGYGGLDFLNRPQEFGRLFEDVF